MRLALPAILCLFTSVAPLAGQNQAPSDSGKRQPVDTMNLLVVDHFFTGRGEFVRVFLVRDVVYRAEVSNPDVTLDIRGLISGTPTATIQPEDFVPEVSRARTYYIRINADATYEIRAVYSSVESAAAPNEAGATGVTRLQLYRDARRTARWNNSDKWAGGLELSWGNQGTFLVEPQGSTVAPPTKTVGGSLLEGCVAVRYGPGAMRRLGGCAFGVSYNWSPDTANVVWFFLEPRVRVVGGESRWAKPLDIGLLVRLGIGEVEKLDRQPGIFAPGVYASYRLTGRHRGPRLVVQGAYRYEWVIESHSSTQTASQETLGLAIY
jgi:hypothetical protein